MTADVPAAMNLTPNRFGVSNSRPGAELDA